MRAGAVFPQLEIGTDPDVIAKYVRTVEELGYDHVVIFDHVLGADPNRPGGWTGAYDADVALKSCVIRQGLRVE